MTIKEAIQANLQIEADNLVDKVIIDRGLTASETYTSSYTGEVEIATAFIYKHLALHPNFKEGGLSISINPDKYLKIANDIFRKYNLLDEVIQGTQPQITIFNIEDTLN